MPTDSPVAFYGYSQGGGAAAGAAELAASYAPELSVKRTFAGAPPSDLLEVVKAVDNHMIAGVAGYAVNGALTRYPELGPLMDRYLNDEGKRYLAAAADECIGQSVENREKTDTRTLTVDGRSLAEILQQDPQVNAVFTGPNYRLDDRALNAPMLLINALHDDTIPYGQARELADAYRGLGGTVDFVTDPLPEMMPQTAMNHAIPIFSQAGTAFEWLVDRFNRVPAGA